MTQESESTNSGPRTIDTVLVRFEQWAGATPDACAVLDGSTDSSYAEIDQRANRLARHLLEAAMPAGATVALAMGRGGDLVVGLLAVLKAGGTYAVVDLESARTAKGQLKAVRPFAVLTHTAQVPRLDVSGDAVVIAVDQQARQIDAHDPEPPDTVPAPDAAVLFAGAASRPVLIGHDRLAAAYAGWAEIGGFTPGDRHLIHTRYDAPAFAAGWTRALCSGGALVFPVGGPGIAGNARSALGTGRVSVVHTDPSGAAWLLGPDWSPVEKKSRGIADLTTVRLVTVSGDRLFLDEQVTYQARLSPGARLLNVYAVTEAAGCGTWFDIARLTHPESAPEGVSLIGTAFPGCRVELRGEEIHLTPPGGGDAIPTGDHGLLRPDGLLEYTGRARDVLRLGSRRVDAHRIESVIRGEHAVGSVLVRTIVLEDKGPTLAAYLAPVAYPGPADAGLPDTAALGRRLKGKLSPQDVPQAVIRLPELPRNRVGQEDREALPLPRSAQNVAGGKRGDRYTRPNAPEGPSSSCLRGCVTFPIALVLAVVLTYGAWTGSTDLSGVPSPYNGLFFILYLFEWLAFATGMAFLAGGRDAMARQGRSPRLTTAAHLSVVYVLASWMPQDNSYRLAAKTDWATQATLVYFFNIPLMIAGAVIMVFVAHKPPDPFHFDE
ncbi:AMP-binding protein [Streptomyces sp. NPDC091371]|uniref:AMP-binding protein n=1 Tax=Streptomyces sp. NPDC091371 TaxID=3155303 RepID=UPI00343D7E47